MKVIIVSRVVGGASCAARLRRLHEKAAAIRSGRLSSVLEMGTGREFVH